MARTEAVAAPAGASVPSVADAQTVVVDTGKAQMSTEVMFQQRLKRMPAGRTAWVKLRGPGGTAGWARAQSDGFDCVWTNDRFLDGRPTICANPSKGDAKGG